MAYSRAKAPKKAVVPAQLAPTASQDSKDTLRTLYLVIACVLTLIGLFYQWCKGSSALINIQYRKTIKTRGLPAVYRENIWHGTGWLDLQTTTFYTLMNIVVVASLEDITYFIGNARQVNPDNLKRCVRSFTYVFNFISYIMIMVSLFVYQIPVDGQSFLVGYPEGCMPREVKLLLILQLAFWLEEIPKVVFEETRWVEDFEDCARAIGICVLLIVSIVSHSVLACMIILAILYARQIIRAIADLITVQVDAISDLALFFSVIHFILCIGEKIAIILITALVATYASNYNQRMIRWIVFFCVVGFSTVTLSRRLLGYLPEDYRQPGGFATNEQGGPSTEAVK